MEGRPAVIGRFVVYTDGRNEYPALVLRDQGSGVLDLAICSTIGPDNAPGIHWKAERNVVSSGAPIPKQGEAPEYLHPRTWRPT